MKMKSVKFEGQLAGDVKKEAYFASLRERTKMKLPRVGETKTVKLKNEELNGAFLSVLDGRGSLKVNGKSVSKMKVYSGEEFIPAAFKLSFTVNRVSDTSCKLSAEIVGC